MNKIFNILVIVTFYLTFVQVAYAVNSATDSAQSSKSEEEIKSELIDKLANDARLKSEKRGIIGTVTDVTNTQITLNDSKGNTRFVDVDELTKFSNPAAKETFGISDIEKDSTVGILGLYNKESRRILARFVNVISVPIVIHGGVSAIDNEDFFLNIATEDGKQTKVEVEALTRTYSYTQANDYIRSGFSKIKENNNIIVIGVPDKKNPDAIIATRILFFPEIPSSPKINLSLERVKKSK